MSWNEVEYPLFLFYYIIGVISILGCALVIAYLLRFGKFHTPFTYVVLYLHISLCLEEIVTLPYLFNEIPTICYIAEMLHYYAVLMNITSVVVIVQIHLCNVIDSMQHYMTRIEKYGPYCIIGFPCIVFLRLIDPVYQETQYPWCVIHANPFNPLLFFTYYLWIYLALTLCLIRCLQSAYYIHLRADMYLAWKYFRAIGGYTFIALLAWLPTTITTVLNANPDDDGSTVIRLYSYLPLYISGLCYTLIFFHDKEAIASFEAYRGLLPPGQEDTTQSGYFVLDVSVKALLFDLVRNVPLHSAEMSIDEHTTSPLLQKLLRRSLMQTTNGNQSNEQENDEALLYHNDQENHDNNPA